MKKYGIQLYSLRDVSKDDFEGTLKAVADMGYKMVESAGFFGHDAKTVKGWLEKYGLEICSTHTGFGLLVDEHWEVLFVEALGAVAHLYTMYGVWAEYLEWQAVEDVLNVLDAV